LVDETSLSILRRVVKGKITHAFVSQFTTASRAFRMVVVKVVRVGRKKI
jgi:hypothetical protein